MSTGDASAGRRNGLRLAAILLLAALPFLAKGLALTWGLKGYLGQSLYKIFQLAAPVAWRSRDGGKRGAVRFWPVDEPLCDRATWILAVAGGLLMATTAIAAAYTVAGRLGVDPLEIRRQLDTRFLMTPGRALAAVVYLFTINAALEELHFRAWLDRELSLLYGSGVGMIVSASAFASMHLLIFRGMPGATAGPQAVVFASLALAGLFWSYLARRPGGIHAAWLSHGLTDALLLTWGLRWLGYL